MEALENVLNCDVSKKVKEHIDYSLEEYKNYLLLLKQLDSKYKKCYFSRIKRDELLNNHEMEHEDKFLCELKIDIDLDTGKKTSIDIVNNLILKNKDMNLDDFVKLHRILIRGTSDDVEKNYSIRDSEVRVSYFHNDKEVIQYYPPVPDEIKYYLDKLFIYMKKIPDDKLKEASIFFKPIIEHFYIAALQPFGNGNTRLARIIEYGDIFKLTRNYIDPELENPSLFLSKNYFLTGEVYRNKIAELVQNPSQDEIDKWLEYNLNIVDEQLYFSQNNVKKLVL